MRLGGWVLKLYENSLGLAFVVLFFGAVAVHNWVGQSTPPHATSSGKVLLAHLPGVDLHLFVVDGDFTIGDRALGPGDAARLDGEGGRSVAVEESGLLAIWAFDRPG